MKRKISFFSTAILLLFFVVSTSVSGQQKELKVLFVGNSYIYTNNLPQIVSIVSEQTGTKLVTRKTVVGGAHLWEHWNGMRELKTKEIIAEGDFDVVILQDFSMSGVQTPDSTLKYVKLFAEFNKAHGAKTYLFDTWARKKVPQFQEEIDGMYEKAAKDNRVKRIPVGTAWQIAMDIRPTIELYTPDGSHPSELGTLLTACMMTAWLTGELPEKLPNQFSITDTEGENVILMYADGLDIEFCLRIAREFL